MKHLTISYLKPADIFQDVMEGIQLQALHDKLIVGNLDPKELTTATRFQKTSFPDGIPECGADALRFSLVSYTTGGEYFGSRYDQLVLTYPRAGY